VLAKYIYAAPVLGCTQIRGVFHLNISSGATVSPSAFSKSLQFLPGMLKDQETVGQEVLYPNKIQITQDKATE
jgi:hypothetical protein